MDPIVWLQLSDLHIRNSVPWSQQEVLGDLLDDIRRRREVLSRAQFILVSGDLAWSGNASEYQGVTAFLESVRSTLGLATGRVLCVPGNHDVNIKTHKLCYRGAIHSMNTASAVNSLLDDRAEASHLLERLSAYRTFEETYMRDARQWRTEDDLGYVCRLDVTGAPISILGLNSAWLANGGDDDRGHLLVAERQVVSAVRKIGESDPALVIAFMHHPLSWLQDFDAAPVVRRISSQCEVLHRGHLHEANVCTVEDEHGGRCIQVAAGAAFATKEFANSYSWVELDVGSGIAKINTALSAFGAFRLLDAVSVPIRLRGSLVDSPQEYVREIEAQFPSVRPVANYITALLHNYKSDVVLRLPSGGLAVGLLATTEVARDPLNSATAKLLNCSNVLRFRRNPCGPKTGTARSFARKGRELLFQAARSKHSGAAKGR